MKNIVHSIARLWIKITSWFFFEKIEISGLENLPKDCPVIFASNHPNAFLDGIILTTYTKKILYYTARGDFFKSKIASALLRFINIIPVYRKEEGNELILKNTETFSYCMDVFKRNEAVLIFPEGGSESEWELRPLRKGAARLAFEAWNNPGIGQNLKVVPVAIHYSSWLKLHPKLYVEFLENIENKSFEGINEAGLFNTTFNKKINTILSGNCIVIDKEKDTSLQEKLVGFILKNFKDGAKLAKKLQNKYLATGSELFQANYNKLSEFITKEDITYYKESSPGIIKFMFSVVVVEIAWQLNAIPYLLSKGIVARAVKHKVFHDSLTYCLLLIIYPLYLITAFFIVKSYFSIRLDVAFVIITLLSASMYEACKKTIHCFWKRKKLHIVHDMLTQLFETGNG